MTSQSGNVNCATNAFIPIINLTFEPNKRHLREALLFCFHLNKTAAEARRLLEEAYDEHAPSKTTCEDWFRRFRNGDFDTDDKCRSGRPKKVKDVDLQALLHKDQTLSKRQLANALNITRQGISKRLRGGVRKVETKSWKREKCVELIHNDSPLKIFDIPDTLNGRTQVHKNNTKKKNKIIVKKVKQINYLENLNLTLNLKDPSIKY